MNIKKIILLFSIFFASLITKGQSKDSLDVMKATQTFLSAFIDFKWETFRNSFSNNATIFFPTWEEGKRKTGKREIEETWLDAFPEFIDSTKKFDLKLSPKDLLIQLYGNTAIVTFHMGEDGNYLSRRSFVFLKEKGEWKIIHLHASNVSK